MPSVYAGLTRSITARNGLKKFYIFQVVEEK